MTTLFYIYNNNNYKFTVNYYIQDFNWDNNMDLLIDSKNALQSEIFFSHLENRGCR